MAARSGADALKKWARRIADNQEDTMAAIDRVEVSPGALAVAKKETWKARVAAAYEKWQRNTGGLPLSTWQEKMKKKGVRRAVEGSQDASTDANNIATFDALMQYTANVKKTVRAMPNATKADRDARRKKAQDMMEQFKKPTSA